MIEKMDILLIIIIFDNLLVDSNFRMNIKILYLMYFKKCSYKYFPHFTGND